jgi:hypothetical protein
MKKLFVAGLMLLSSHSLFAETFTFDSAQRQNYNHSTTKTGSKRLHQINFTFMNAKVRVGSTSRSFSEVIIRVSATEDLLNNSLIPLNMNNSIASLSFADSIEKCISTKKMFSLNADSSAAQYYGNSSLLIDLKNSSIFSVTCWR